MGDCRHCGRKAGFLRRAHRECEQTRDAGWSEMVRLTAAAATAPDFHSAVLQQNLEAVAARSFIPGGDIPAAIAEGWRQAVRHGLADGLLTQDEESRLRAFRERLNLSEETAGADALAQAARDRLMLDARLAALAVDDGARHLAELQTALERSGLAAAERRQTLVQAWEAAVEGSLEDGVLSLDEEGALSRYLDHFGLSSAEVNRNGSHTDLVKSAVIREAAEGLVPNRLNLNAPAPFNLMKSEQLVWLINGVDYFEVKTRRERRGTSHGLSIRVARGLYYRPSSFRSRVHEWEETAHEDTGVLGITSKHLYFHGRRKRFRIRYDRIVSFEPYSDGLEVMRDAQTAKPQSFRTGDGWFIYNLVTNLSQQQ